MSESPIKNRLIPSACLTISLWPTSTPFHLPQVQSLKRRINLVYLLHPCQALFDINHRSVNRAMTHQILDVVHIDPFSSRFGSVGIPPHVGRKINTALF